MRRWLLTQVMVFLPSLVFCLMLTVLYFVLPEDRTEPLPLLETAATGISIVQQHTDGKEVNMQATKLVRKPDGIVNITNLRLNITLPSGRLVLKNDTAILDENKKELTFSSAAGEISTAGRRATLSLQQVSYWLEDGNLSGEAVVISEADKTLTGEQFNFKQNEQLEITGNIRASFSLGEE